MFHVLGLKCQECGSYNTCRTAGPDDEAGDNPETNDSVRSEEPSGSQEDLSGDSTSAPKSEGGASANPSTSS